MVAKAETSSVREIEKKNMCFPKKKQETKNNRGIGSRVSGSVVLTVEKYYLENSVVPEWLTVALFLLLLPLSSFFPRLYLSFRG